MNNRFDPSKFDEVMKFQNDMKKHSKHLEILDNIESTPTEKLSKEYNLLKSKNIHKSYANAMVSALTTMGAIRNPKICEKCKKHSETVVAHHENYFSPLQIQWLCGTCHQNRHHELREKMADPANFFYQKILESPEGDNYLNRLRQFYIQVAKLSSELFDKDFWENANAIENTPTLSISYKDVGD